MCLRNRGTEMMSRWRFDMREDQRQQVQNERTSGSRLYDLSKKLRMHHRRPTSLVSLEYPASGETQDWLGSELVQMSGHVEMDG